MPRTFFEDKRSENSPSHSRPSCGTPVAADLQVQCCDFDSMATASSEPHNDPTVETVDLFPSELEIRDLFPDPNSNLRFDLVKLTCRPCKKRFFSARGHENHLFAVHNVRPETSDRSSPPCDVSLPPSLPPPELLALGVSTGPPPCAPFTRLSPVKTWASVAAKPAISPRQIGAGKLLREQPAASTTPRRPRITQPSRARGGPGQIAPTADPPPAKTSRKRITFEKDPDKNSHVVLLPAKPVSRNRKQLPCNQCDFVFRSLKSRDDHMVVHVLEEQFHKLHGLVNNAPSFEFDDFVLPKPPPPILILDCSVPKPPPPPNCGPLLRHA
ncbi:hypothetical protein CEXT_360551 [Caerostris extrusa]|uniref:C2H2-type domain-containing protein n=1 Tax=Caerostris extrusa TaxID=172846 RepID=A0AAV4W4E3_CAEEX|nr:hypothetical protein CEXT_360551 [Caerostris extrusa]